MIPSPSSSPSDLSPLQSPIRGIDQVWVINLDRRPDRLQSFLTHHPELEGCVNRLSAYDGKSLKLTPPLARLFAPNNFDWHKPTMGCALSHLELWQRLANESGDNASYLILEDDARMSRGWIPVIEHAFESKDIPTDWQILYLGGILPQYRNSFDRNIESVKGPIARVRKESIFGKNPPGYFHFCAYAYILNKRGAQRILELLKSWKGYWLQADFVAAYTTPDLSPARPIYFFYPLIAQSFQDTGGGFARPYDDNQKESAKVDSDIWKNDDRFTAKELLEFPTENLPLDIPAALGSASHANLTTVSPTAVNDPKQKKVGLICVTRNAADRLKITLDSILRHTSNELFDLYVVDNASTDATQELCSKHWPINFHFIRSETNLGWVGAINSCLPMVEENSFVGFLNDDIEVGSRWLEYLVGVLERYGEVGAVGPLTSNDRDWQGYDRFNNGPIKPNLPPLEGIDRNDVSAMAAITVSFNPGVIFNDAVLAFFCVLIRSEVIKKVGPLDPSFNDLYLGDDDDYCRRIIAAGYNLALSFNAYVAHHSGSRSLLVNDYEDRIKKAVGIISRKYALNEFEEVDGQIISQNLGHMVCEGHLGGFFSEGDGGTYYPVMWTHLVRKYGLRSVLDIGCGRGYSALHFKSQGCGIKGVDGSKEAAATNLIGDDFVYADYSLGLSGIVGSFDLVWSCEFVEHVEERYMANYLRDFQKGSFLAMTFAGPGQPGHHHVNCRPSDYWIRMLYAYGFDYLPDETKELREMARKDMEKNNRESDKRFVYHFIERGLFFHRGDICTLNEIRNKDLTQ